MASYLSVILSNLPWVRYRIYSMANIETFIPALSLFRMGTVLKNFACLKPLNMVFEKSMEISPVE